MPHDFDTDHHFTGDQQAEYDALSAKGRTEYDEERWYHGATHTQAFAVAYIEHGLKKRMIMSEESLQAMRDLGLDWSIPD